MTTVLSRRATVRLTALALAVSALGVGPGGGRLLAQGDEAVPEADVLFTAVVEELPAPPATVRLERIALEPGAAVPSRAQAGPAFVVVEAGSVTVEVAGEAVVSLAERDGEPARALVPAAGEPVELQAGDQLAVPAGVPFSLAQAGADPASLLAVAVLPAADGSGMDPPASTPIAATGGGVTTTLLGQAVASGWPAPPFVVQLDRVEVAQGEAIPGFPGPVLLAVEEGAFVFALTDGAIQAAGTASAGADDGANNVFRVEAGQAIFFAGGVNAIPRDAAEAGLGLLRFGVASVPADAEVAGTPAAGTGAEPVVGTPAAAPPPIADGDQTGTRLRISDDGVRLRATPSTGGEVVAELGRGDEVIVVGDPVEAEGLRWLPVRVTEAPGVEGFIAEQFVEPAG